MKKHILTVVGTPHGIWELKEKYGLSEEIYEKASWNGDKMMLLEVKIAGDLGAIGQHVDIVFVHESEEIETFCWG